MPKVSVIIPVYKVGKYIENSMKSVVARRFKDFEVLLSIIILQMIQYKSRKMYWKVQG